MDEFQIFADWRDECLRRGLDGPHTDAGFRQYHFLDANFAVQGKWDGNRDYGVIYVPAPLPVEPVGDGNG